MTYVCLDVPLGFLCCGVGFYIGVHVIGFVLFRTISLLALYTLYLS